MLENYVNYILYLLIIISIFLILTVGQNITLGNLGLLSLGNIAFFSIGAYVFTIFIRNDVSFILSFLAAGVLGAFISLFMSIITKNIESDYYALGTLSFYFVIQNFLFVWTPTNIYKLLNWMPLSFQNFLVKWTSTKGSLGIFGISKPVLFGFVFDSLFEFLLFSFFIALVVLILVYFFLKSSYNLVMGSVRDNKDFSEILGISPFKVKLEVMAFVGFISGIAGALYSSHLNYIDPGVFSIALILLIWTIVIVGGIASFWGCVLACVLILLIPEFLRFLPLPNIYLGPLREIVFAVILILIIFLRPKGFFGRVEVN